MDEKTAGADSTSIEVGNTITKEKSSVQSISTFSSAYMMGTDIGVLHWFPTLLYIEIVVHSLNPLNLLDATDLMAFASIFIANIKSTLV